MNLPMVKGQCSEGLIGFCNKIGTDSNLFLKKEGNRHANYLSKADSSCKPVSKKIGDGGNAGCRVEGQRIYREVSRQRGDENRVTDAGNGDGKRRSVTMASREEGVETEVERAEGRV
ncbi:hypothetical protein ACOSQ4_032260 [Xanthoceras sorbifolium]